MTKIKLLSLLLLISFLTACGQKNTGPADIKWDRDACERCQMMLSDRQFSAQVRVFSEKKRSRVFAFDDLGCAVIWLDNQEKVGKTWKTDPKTEIWVTEYQTGKWIDAKTAWYIPDQRTPMNYGLGALTNKQDNSMNYEQARIQIYEVEKKYNVHGGSH